VDKPEATQLLRSGQGGILQWNLARESGGGIPNLDGIELENADLQRADLGKVWMCRADLRAANLTEADLTGAHLVGADLESANLRRADLLQADLSDAVLRCSSLRGANAQGANLGGSVLYDADLSQANLTGAFFSAARLDRADLQEASLERADLFGAALVDAQLARASLVAAKLREAEVTGADLREADLSGADVRRADLSRSDLRGIFTGTPTGPKPRGLLRLLEGDVGFRLDDTRTTGTRFSPDIREPWSILKRTYDWPPFFLLVILAAVAWLTIVIHSGFTNLHQAMIGEFAFANEQNRNLANGLSSEDARSGGLPSTRESSPSTGSRIGPRFAPLRSRGSAVFGVPQPVFALFLIIALALAVRLALTYRIRRWAEIERSTGFSPAWQAYRVSWIEHRVLKTASWMLILAAIIILVMSA
jgi:uncharacterized protein YjbI with pentapeptide repeats